MTCASSASSSVPLAPLPVTTLSGCARLRRAASPVGSRRSREAAKGLPPASCHPEHSEGPPVHIPAQYDPIAELYDGYPGNYLEDVLFFVEEGKRAASPVLEVGIGTGRLALCLAAVGIDVVGIDSSRQMVRVLQRKLAGFPDLPGRVRAVVADMRRFALRQQFPLAMVPFRTFLYLLTPDDQRRALRAIRRHLRPGGRLVMAFFVPPPEAIARGYTERAEMSHFLAPDGSGEVVAYDWTEFGEEQRVVSHITYQWKDHRGLLVREIEHALTARYMLPDEVPPLLEECGYRVAACFGGFDRKPLTAGSPEQVWIAERAPRQEMSDENPG